MRVELTEPEPIEATVTIIMTLTEAKRLRMSIERAPLLEELREALDYAGATA